MFLYGFGNFVLWKLFCSNFILPFISLSALLTDMPPVFYGLDIWYCGDYSIRISC